MEWNMPAVELHRGVLFDFWYSFSSVLFQVVEPNVASPVLMTNRIHCFIIKLGVLHSRKNIPLRVPWPVRWVRCSKFSLLYRPLRLLLCRCKRHDRTTMTRQWSVQSTSMMRRWSVTSQSSCSRPRSTGTWRTTNRFMPSNFFSKLSSYLSCRSLT